MICSRKPRERWSKRDMAEPRELLFRLAECPRALSEMEKDLQSFLSARRMHGTVNLNIPPEIYTPLETSFLESDVFHKRVYPIAAADVDLGSITLWSYRPMDSAQTQEIEIYLYPWILAFRHRLMVDVGRGNFFGRQMFTASEVDFYKRRIWYEIERGKRYNVFLTYFRVALRLSPDIHEERIGDGLRRILRAFEPSVCLLENARLDFLKIGQAAAAAERFLAEIHEALRLISCEAQDIQKWTFPKDFFEYDEFLEKISL